MGPRVFTNKQLSIHYRCNDNKNTKSITGMENWDSTIILTKPGRSHETFYGWKGVLLQTFRFTAEPVNCVDKFTNYFPINYRKVSF